jgi:hypothetical protein
MMTAGGSAMPSPEIVSIQCVGKECNVSQPQTQALERIKYTIADILDRSPDHPTPKAALGLKSALKLGES